MKKLLYILIMMIFLSISIASAEFQYGIYTEDIAFQIVNNTDDSRVQHLRDNFYGVAYVDTSNNGYVRVLEIDGTAIINSSVDEWNFGAGVGDFEFHQLDNSTGMSLVSLISGGAGYYKTFDVYANGTINPRDSKTETADSFGSVETVKTSSTTYLSVLEVENIKSGVAFFHTTGGTVAVNGLITLATDSTPWFEIPADYAREINLEKVGTTCYLIYKRSGEGQYSTNSCGNEIFNGGGPGLSTASTLSATQFEANEVTNIDSSYDEDAGFIYLAYGETLDDYPVIAVRNATGFGLLDKERLFSNTTTNNKIFALSSNNFLTTYVLNNRLYAESYSVGLDGTMTAQYDAAIFVNSGFNDLVKMPTTFDKYLLSFEDYGDLSVRTLGIGLIPPPDPDETTITLKDEATLGDFNDTNLDLTFYAYCVDNIAYQTDINSSTTSIPVSCNYTSFAIKVEYSDIFNDTQSYLREYVRDLDDTYGQFDLDVYLINPYNTNFIKVVLTFDDLINDYTNSVIYFEKNINGVTTQITASYKDILSRMSTYLIVGDRYYIYIDSDQTDKTFLGDYLVIDNGLAFEAIALHLYDIQTRPDFINLVDKVSYLIYEENNVTGYELETLINTSSNNLINVTFNVYNGTPEYGTLIYSETNGGAYDPDNLFGFLSGSFNYEDYVNESVYGEIIFYYDDNGEIRFKTYNTQVNIGEEDISMPLLDYVSPQFMDWFIVIILFIVAIFATIKSADIVSIVVMGLAGVFMVFGLFSITSGTLALGILIAIINILSKGGAE